MDFATQIDLHNFFLNLKYHNISIIIVVRTNLTTFPHTLTNQNNVDSSPEEFGISILIPIFGYLISSQDNNTLSFI